MALLTSTRERSSSSTFKAGAIFIDSGGTFLISKGSYTGSNGLSETITNNGSLIDSTTATITGNISGTGSSPAPRRNLVSNPHPEFAEPTRNEVIGVLAHRLSGQDSIGTGPLAELRRLDPAGPLSEPALHRLLTRVPQPWLSGDGLRRWALIVHAMALAAPRSGGLGSQRCPRCQLRTLPLMVRA
jgi:hypothetical protein